MELALKRLERMKYVYPELDIVFDIGAHHGTFGSFMKRLYPKSKIFAFEADQRHRHYLGNVFFVLLGDEVRESVNFYTLPSDYVTTGSSIYREQTPHYSDCITVQMPMTTIDALSQEHDFSGDWQNGLIKIDVQGAELDIIKGSKKFIEQNKPGWFLLETSILPYNLGAPLAHEVIAYMDQIGYRICDVIDLVYNKMGDLEQVDYLFKRKDL